jgi:hypothetical protein
MDIVRRMSRRLSQSDPAQLKGTVSGDEADGTLPNLGSSGAAKGKEAKKATLRKVATLRDLPPWTKSQEAQLFEAVKQVSQALPKKQRWKQIAEFVEGHNKRDCYDHFRTRGESGAAPAIAPPDPKEAGRKSVKQLKSSVALHQHQSEKNNLGSDGGGKRGSLGNNASDGGGKRGSLGDNGSDGGGKRGSKADDNIVGAAEPDMDAIAAAAAISIAGAVADTPTSQESKKLSKAGSRRKLKLTSMKSSIRLSTKLSGFLGRTSSRGGQGREGCQGTPRGSPSALPRALSQRLGSQTAEIVDRLDQSIGFITAKFLSRQVEEGQLRMWPETNTPIGHWRVTTVLGQPPRRIVQRVNIKPTDLHGKIEEGGVSKDINPDALAAVAALAHIAKHQLHQTARHFVNPQAMSTLSLPMEDRGLSSQFLADFKREFKIPADMQTTVVRQILRFLTAGTGRSFAELMQGRQDSSGQPYLATANLFVSHFAGHDTVAQIGAIQAFESREGRKCFSFIDVFATNQSEIAPEREMQSVGRVIECTQTTLLLLSPWHSPTALTRLWCLLEAMLTLNQAGKGCVLKVAFCDTDRKSLRLALQGGHPQAYGPKAMLDAVAAIDSESAKTDLVEYHNLLSVQILAEGGFDELNKKVSKALKKLLVAAVEEEAAHLMRGVAIELDELKTRLERFCDAFAPDLKTRVDELIRSYGGGGSTPSWLNAMLRAKFDGKDLATALPTWLETKLKREEETKLKQQKGSVDSSSSKGSVDSSSSQTWWDCAECTFRNGDSYTVCEMCNAPKPGISGTAATDDAASVGAATVATRAVCNFDPRKQAEVAANEEGAKSCFTVWRGFYWTHSTMGVHWSTRWRHSQC